MDKQIIINRLSRLRESMKKEGVDAYIIPSSDHHLSEYPPQCWKDREWISSFNGSAGTVMVTADHAGLWTDSRYFLQGSEQLKGTTIELYKMGVPGTPTIAEYIRDHKASIRKVGFFGKSMSAAEALGTQNALAPYGIEVVWDKDLITPLHEEPMTLPMFPFYEQPLKYAGMSVKEKLSLLRKTLLSDGANSCIITMLDEIAWLFNVRGTDVLYNPVGIAYGLVTPSAAYIYTMEGKIPSELEASLSESGVKVRPYNDIYKDVAALTSEEVVLLDNARTNYALFKSIPAHTPRVVKTSAITRLKAVKNAVEVEGYRKAMQRDGVALTRFFIWLEKALERGETPSEYEIGVTLAEFRAKGDLYVSDSFSTICGYNGNGAIVHYSAQKEGCKRLERKGILLLDSGGQYRDGTTDITRTVSLDGNPTARQKADYTRVLKGHIAIATAIFPQGTRGSQLDILARKALWDVCQNYGHGTGHGVGHFLNVHEGPQNIRMDENPALIELGCFTSNEPGLYIAGEYGIRIENLILCVPHKETEFGAFYAFDTLTMCYLDNNLVDVSLMTPEEIKWYNDYQAKVYAEVSPSLTAEEAAWLKTKTAPLSA
ncbi:MAG: aminopeptidase P family protein [Porphyromonas sp.]|nr:aminopeptidase P family protein [Porphyromonas sp.]